MGCLSRIVVIVAILVQAISGAMALLVLGSAGVPGSAAVVNSPLILRHAYHISAFMASMTSSAHDSPAGELRFHVGDDVIEPRAVVIVVLAIPAGHRHR